MRERTEMSRGRGGRLARGRSDVHAPRSSSEIFTLRGPGGVVIPPIVPRRPPVPPHSTRERRQRMVRTPPGGVESGAMQRSPARRARRNRPARPSRSGPRNGASVGSVTDPDFGADLGPELETAMAAHRREVEAIAAGPWPPGFADTIAALEAAGDRLHRAEQLLDDASSARSTAAIRALDAQMRPRLAAHRDAVALDARVVARIEDLFGRRDALAPGAGERWVRGRPRRGAVRGGATLGEPEQARVRAINQRLAALAAEFRRRLLAETDALALHVTDAAELDGLPAPMADAARRAAGTDGGFRLALALPSVQPALEYLHDRAVRERLWRASVARGRRGGPDDNRPVVAEIAALRAERAGLLGFGSHAEYAIAEQTAGSLAAVDDLLGEVGAAAADAARADGERHAAALRADGHAGPLQPWDWPYYAARERLERHALDETRVREHFVLDRVLRDGAFALAGRLYGLRFEELVDAPRPHPDVAVFDVRDEDGAERGRLYVDPFPRD